MEEVRLIDLGSAKGAFRSYEIKKMSPGNLERSLKGAAQRSHVGIASAMVGCKPGIDGPEELEYLCPQKYGLLFNIWTEGEVEDGKLLGFASLKEDWTKLVPVTIPVGSIDSCSVCFNERPS